MITREPAAATAWGRREQDLLMHVYRHGGIVGREFPPYEYKGVIEVVGEHGGELDDVHDIAGEVYAVGIAAVVAEDAAAVAVVFFVGEMAQETLGEGILEGDREVLPLDGDGASAIGDE